MPDTDLRRIRLLQAALDLRKDERDAWLAQQCGEDVALLASLRTLLALDASTSPLDTPLDALAAELIGADDAEPETTDHAGERVGPWRLLNELGHGGMGSVWLAERADGEFSHRVALKLIKLGMDSRQVQRQFRHERDVLARLQHPNIAQLIDGGVDARGRPWFAMELVEGVGLRDWIAQHAPDLRERLALFVKLCRAVAHAHQQLVVHRDLKPSNVLVQADHEPRLLDFGIAKLIENDDPDQTATAQRFLTRDFAAPEQLRGEPVSTATDVYALGLILFELLTGHRYRALHGDADSTLRPSLALARSTDATTTPTRMSRAQLRGDLDAITLRALADEPVRRYAGAQALAEDVQRYLDGEPVAARPDGFVYRSTKFVRRNRAAVMVAALGLSALLAASGIAFWQAHAKSLEAEQARIALKQSEAISGFIEDVFLGADPLRTRGTDTTAGELLQAARDKVARTLGDEPGVAAAILNQIGQTYVTLAADDAARETLSEALAFNARAAQPSRHVAAAAGARLAFYRAMDGDAQAGLTDLDRIIDGLYGQESGIEDTLAKALQLKASVLSNLGQGAASLASSAESVRVLSAHADAFPVEYIAALSTYADAAAGAGRGAEALDAAERALAQPLLRGAAPPRLKLDALAGKVRALQTLKRNAEVEPLLVEVLNGYATLYGMNSGFTRYWRYRHAQTLQTLGRLDEAQAIIDALLDTPSDGMEQPVAHIAHAVTGASLARARGAPDAQRRIDLAEQLACADAGNPSFCAKARALRAAP